MLPPSTIQTCHMNGEWWKILKWTPNKKGRQCTVKKPTRDQTNRSRFRYVIFLIDNQNCAKYTSFMKTYRKRMTLIEKLASPGTTIDEWTLLRLLKQIFDGILILWRYFRIILRKNLSTLKFKRYFRYNGEKELCDRCFT